MQTDWFFPPNHGGEESGLNDAGIQFFKTAGSLARETIQNSGDAAEPGRTGPVRVEFELLKIPRTDIPQVEKLEWVIQQCRDYMHSMCPRDEERAQNGEAEFTRALALLSNGSIPVLRIGDYNTTGLVGDDSMPMSPWYRLIKRQGTASMHGAGGGTFGIGQRAPFAFSALRTVYYSTKLANGNASVIGKSILSTFKNASGEKCRPVGYWGWSRTDGTGVEPLTNRVSVPPVFQRPAVGTDLFVLGYSEEGWRRETTWAVLRHFFAAILDKRIVVDIKGPGEPPLRIDAGSLTSILDQELEQARKAANGRKGELEEVEVSLGSTRHFVRALTAPHDGQPTVGTIEKLGEVRLHLALAEDAPSRVAFMRKPRILVFDKRQKQLKDYAAVFLCESDEGNRALAALEDPSHTIWDRTRAKGGDRLLRDVNAFVRESLKKVFDKDREEAEDIPDLARFLPEEGSGSDRPAKGSEKRTNTSGKEETAAIHPVVGRIQPVKVPKPKPPPPAPEEGGDGGGSDPIEKVIPGAGLGDRGGEGGGGEPPIGVVPPPSPTGPPALRPSDLRFRSFYDKDKGCIQLVLSSRRKGIGDVDLTAVGEDSNYPLIVQSAEDADSGDRIAVSGGTLRDVLLEQGTRRRILIRLDGDQHLALSAEVRHGR